MESYFHSPAYYLSNFFASTKSHPKGNISVVCKRVLQAGWHLMTRRSFTMTKSLQAAMALYCGFFCISGAAFADKATEPQNQAASGTPSEQKDSPTAEPANSEGSQQQGSASLQVFLPPVLERNKPAWGSIYDAMSGELVSDQKILINKKEYSSDDYGSFNFLVPDSDGISVCVVNSSGKKLWEINYVSSEHGLLVSDKNAATIIDNLDELSSHAGNEPIISHAPSVVEPLQTLVVVGKNFSGKQGDDEIEIDDRPADLLAASPRSMVAVSHRFMAVGPIKEMHVCRRDLCSLPIEVDVTQASLKVEPASAGKSKLRINVAGSTLPVVVSVMNDSVHSNIRFGGWRLGRQNIFLSPGGQLNSFSTEMDSNLAAEALTVHLVSNGIFDPYSMRANINLLPKAVAETSEKAEIIRLKKREIGLEMQGAAVKQELEAASKNNKLSVEEQRRLDSVSSSIYARLFRVQKMLQSRRAVLEGMGDTDYSKLIDTACSGASASLESLMATKDLGFTEARLIKVVGRRSEEQKIAQQNLPAYMMQYSSTPPAALQKYRKKFGKRTYIPPPPATMALVPPPVPYSPSQNELGPFLSSPAIPSKPSALQSVRSGASSSSPTNKKSKSKSRGAVDSQEKGKKHKTTQAANRQSAHVQSNSSASKQSIQNNKSNKLGSKGIPRASKTIHGTNFESEC